MLGEGFGEVFGRLGLACARWALRSAAKVELERHHEGPVAPVCERGDDQPWLVAEILEAVPSRGADHAGLEL